jgi:hypothetical protein
MKSSSASTISSCESSHRFVVTGGGSEYLFCSIGILAVGILSEWLYVNLLPYIRNMEEEEVRGVLVDDGLS